MRFQSSIKTILTLLLATAAGLVALSPGSAAAATPLKIEVLSSQANRVTGGDAMIGVTAPNTSARNSMIVRLNGKVVTGSLSADPASPLRKIGVVTGLRNGRNWITAWTAGQNGGSRLAVYNSSLQGPVFSGPHQQPFYCTTESFGLGPAQGSECFAPTKVS